MVFRDKTEDRVTQVVWHGAGGPSVVACTVHASNGMWTLVKRVISLGGPTIVAWGCRLWAQLQHVVWSYLDGGNGIGMIPS